MPRMNDQTRGIFSPAASFLPSRYEENVIMNQAKGMVYGIRPNISKPEKRAYVEAGAFTVSSSMLSEMQSVTMKKMSVFPRPRNSIPNRNSVIAPSRICNEAELLSSIGKKTPPVGFAFQSAGEGSTRSRHPNPQRRANRCDTKNILTILIGSLRYQDRINLCHLPACVYYIMASAVSLFSEI